MSAVFIPLAVVNAAELALFGLDKHRARAHARRIPEKTLFLLAILGGSPGALLGMYLFRHKTKKPAFTFGIPLILALQLAAGLFLLR